ncbi:MAG TPA: hypothetical protein VH394_08620 [Thermoanaerobaculia bacterium]|jgi:hypothetical protein|nr:hypothetical protein [Thermoanaerobaculia bacterium]
MRSSFLATLALALLALQLAVAVPRALLRSAREGSNLLAHWSETPYERRVRTFGPGYAQAIEKIRRTIPVDGAYALINAHPDVEEGGPVWVKFDLAPRRAVYLGKLDEVGSAERLRRRMPRAARWVVITYGAYDPPVLIERFRFIRQIEERKGG